MKHKLSLQALEIDTFEVLPADVAEARGTVQAHSETDIYEGCGTLQSGCCQQNTDDPGECGIGSYNCISYGYDCTWYPVLMCTSNPIAFPTDPRCDRQNCGLTTVC